MRYFNVFLYNACPIDQNPEGQPSYWVWKVQKCSPTSPVPDGAVRMTMSELRAYKQSKKLEYNAWVNSKVEISVPSDAKVKKAIKNVNNVINKFCAENMVLGVVQAGKTKLIADALKDVFYYAQTGSLYECLASLDAVTITPDMSPFITAQRKAELREKINNLIINL